MARRRIAVALLPDPATSAQVQALRVALDDPRRDDLPPHLTLVPPVNLDAEALTALRRVVRAIATRADPFELTLGPVATFAPATPTLHLDVSGDTVALGLVRDALRVPPIDRPDDWPFSPHVTLRESFPEDQIDTAVALLPGTVGSWTVDRIHVLEQFRTEQGPYWSPVIEEPFGGPDVVGRGGIELVLRTLRMIEPEVAALLERARAGDDAVSGGDDDADPHDDPDETNVMQRRAPSPSRSDLVVVAELPGCPGEPIAAAVGAAGPSGASLRQIHVASEHQGFGVGRQVSARWCLEAARSGARVAVPEPGTDVGALQSWGFSMVGRTLVRQLGDGQDL